MRKVDAGQLAKNTSYLTVAFMVQKLFSFFYFIYIAHSISDVHLGKYSFALSFSSIFSIFIDLGLGPVLTREAAKHSEHEQEYLKKILGIKTVLTFVAVALMYATLLVIHVLAPLSTLDFQLIGIATGIIILDSFTFTFYSIFRGRQILKYESVGIMIYQLIIVSSGSFVLFFKLPVYALLIAIAAGSLFNFLYSMSLVVFTGNLHIGPEFDWAFTKKILKIAAPFAVAGIFFKLNGHVDTVMLKVLAGDQYTGWYAVAFKLTTALTVLPGALATGYFPAVSHFLVADKSCVPKIFEKSMLYLMIISVPISFGVFALADNIVRAIFPEVFSASAGALQVFMIGLVFLFLNYPVGNLLNAANKQMLNTINMGIALLANVTLNFILIPKFTFMGASVSASVSAMVLIMLGLPRAYKIAPFDITYLLKKLGQTILGGLVMALALVQLQNTLHVSYLILIGAIIYFIILFGIGTIRRQDVSVVLRNFQRLARKII